MASLLDRLTRIFDEGHGSELPRLRTDAAFAPPGEIRPAAVMIGVTDRPEPGVLLTHRPLEMREHAGQVAFPGGKIDPGEDAIAAALRETHEELGITPSYINIIGSSDRFITGTGFEITPVLGLLPPDIEVIPNPREVSGWFEAPLRYILDPANREYKKTMYRGRLRSYTEIVWEGHRIWGVTAAIIENLSHRLAWEGLVDG
ncbi:MAG TPA: CoA pyrophosphatase [Sphingomonadaceae bacterium]|nr:CoA pyrophosphatase [Sphingomonadaceae bacterium]